MSIRPFFCHRRRMNPCTLGWYLPILVRDVPGALQPSSEGKGGNSGSGGGCIGEAGDGHYPIIARGASTTNTTTTTTLNSTSKPMTTTIPTEPGRDIWTWSWSDLDAKFRRDLPDEAYVGRLAYRGLVMRSCGKVRVLDGVEVGEKERIKAGAILEGILGRRKLRGGMVGKGG